MSSRLAPATAMQWVCFAARLVLGLVFLVSGLDKLPSPLQATEAVQSYQIISGGLATLWAYGQPGLEIALGVLLIAGLATRLVAVLTGLLLLAYLGGIASVWARGISIDPGFFTGGGPVAATQTHYLLDILRDTGFFALAVIIAVWPPGQVSVDEMLAPWLAGRGGRATGEDG